MKREDKMRYDEERGGTMTSEEEKIGARPKDQGKKARRLDCSNVALSADYI